MRLQAGGACPLRVDGLNVPCQTSRGSIANGSEESADQRPVRVRVRMKSSLEDLQDCVEAAAVGLPIGIQGGYQPAALVVLVPAVDDHRVRRV